MKKIFLILLVCTISLSSLGGVSIKNGNFWMSYVDISIPGTGNMLEIKRTYNSVSTYEGWFGIGWANKFETYLRTTADGAVIVHQGGAGTKVSFETKKGVNITAASKRILAEIKKKRSLNKTAEKTLYEKLLKDADFRRSVSTNYNLGSSIKKGVILHATSMGVETLKRTSKGWIRYQASGRKEKFNNEGKLTQIAEASGYKIDLVYNKEKRIKTIRDSKAKAIYMSWYSNGKVKNIWSVGKKKVLYKYDGLLLSEATNIVGTKYVYSYDKNFNMTKITYNDGTSMAISYDPQSLRVAGVTNRSGKKTAYKFDSNPSDPNHYWTLVTKNGFDNKPVTSRYEYQLKKKEDGSLYTYRIFTDIAGFKTDTIYSKCCGAPLQIKRGSRVTNFEYSDDGFLVSKKSNNGTFVKIDYDKKMKKITRVVNQNGWTNFKYDKRGNLSKAWNKVGQAVLLLYNREGKIAKMVDQPPKAKDRSIASERKVVSFRYNAQGKPMEITMKNVGSIHVQYDNYGRVAKVDSKQGPKLAVLVTSTFQRLMKLVKPAGVSLGI